MTSDFLGQCIGYANPRKGMSNLVSRNKAALEPHQFVLTVRTNSGAGRPSYFYNKGGIVKAFMLAATPQAKEHGPKIIDYIEQLEAKRMERIERYWFGKRPFWPEIRERVMAGQPFRLIAEAMGRSPASVRNAVKRMIEVGILQPLRASQAAVTGTARKAIIRYGRKFGDVRQHLLPGFSRS